jgi:hypothetical protein
VANYDPRKDRHKPAERSAPTSLDALLGPSAQSPDTTTAGQTSDTLDSSSLDDRVGAGRPVATPEPSGLPQRVPVQLKVAVVVGAVLGATVTIWIALRLRSLFKR